MSFFFCLTIDCPAKKGFQVLKFFLTHKKLHYLFKNLLRVSNSESSWVNMRQIQNVSLRRKKWVNFGQAIHKIKRDNQLPIGKACSIMNILRKHFKYIREIFQFYWSAMSAFICKCYFKTRTVYWLVSSWEVSSIEFINQQKDIKFI